MEDMVMLITNVGFPIAVASYLLIRFESKIDALTLSINGLTNVVLSNSKGDDNGCKF
ncbi:YvrJ family protein [Clostridium botulinum]|uniref:YvrJ family protein n=1 Tax=Clostridium botulinum TaxID=1491 RepID=A0A6M0SSK8_CLOBO|nr:MULTISPECIES: YvrJ family protein [Clostridium]MCS6131098.1 YvrJ family protein [Clostridium botulinum]NFA43759.1 YvrJ family protein [Clostridium botulinum]NFG25113.1 YvrJ family protein [Clostridium botulinum]NFL45354.1 YvrJ family protein [Clostridium botulinum]NFL90428.1 YvrJ family protein [Clostridium botulinum]